MKSLHADRIFEYVHAFRPCTFFPLCWMKTCIVLSHFALLPHMKTFMQWRQICSSKMLFHALYHQEQIFAEISDQQQPWLVVVNKFFQRFSITGWQNVQSTNFESGQTHHNLRINFGIHQSSSRIFHHAVRNLFFIHHDVLNQIFIHHDVLDHFFINHNLRVTFPSSPTFLIRQNLRIKFPYFPSRECWNIPNSQPIHLIHSSWDLRHPLLDTAPTLLRCNDFFVHPSHRIHPT